jgi:hypothetical protein
MFKKKNKKGFVVGFLIFPLILILILFILLIIFWSKISPFFDFLVKYWWVIALLLFSLMWHKQIKVVVNAILNKLGIKI